MSTERIGFGYLLAGDAPVPSTRLRRAALWLARQLDRGARALRRWARRPER